MTVDAKIIEIIQNERYARRQSKSKRDAMFVWQHKDSPYRKKVGRALTFDFNNIHVRTNMEYCLW